LDSLKKIGLLVSKKKLHLQLINNQGLGPYKLI